jgi:uncharacterized paraquat-inducible protein A
MAEPDEVGDPVCWLDRLCSECRAVPTEDQPAVCWRCGAALEPRSHDDDPA